MFLITALALFISIYAALTCLTWLRRLIGERAARRAGMGLNMARRALPPAIAGLILIMAAPLLARPEARGLGAILLAGGLAFGFHKGLSDLGQNNIRSLALRLTITLCLSLFALWQLGLL